MQLPRKKNKKNPAKCTLFADIICKAVLFQVSSPGQADENKINFAVTKARIVLTVAVVNLLQGLHLQR